MTDMTSEIAAEISKLKENLPDGPYLINDILTTTGKYSPLLESENTQLVGVEKKERKFSLKEPAYIRRIELTGSAQEIAQDMEITLTLADGKRLTPRITKSSETKTQCLVNNFITDFTIQSNHTIIKPHITKIDVIGYSISSLPEISKNIKETITTKFNIETLSQEHSKKLETTTNQITANESIIHEISNKITDLEAQKTNTLTEIDSLSEQSAELTSQIKNLESEISIKTTALNSTTNNYEQLSQQSKELNQSIATKKSELNKIISDRNLISDEYKDYVKEGKGQSRIYTGMAALSLAAIIFCVYELYKGADRILHTPHENSLEILSSLILRIPFAIVFSLGIFYSWKLTKSLLSRIFKIHEDRLTLAKLLVIAKDTVFSATSDLQIDDHTKFQERIKLKVEILKSHLAKDLDRSFTYYPTTHKSELTPATEEMPTETH